MAVYECDWGRHRYPQAQQSIYYTHVIGAVADVYKMRLCPKHFRESVVFLEEHLTVIDEDSMSDSTCTECNADKCALLFAKVFPAKEEMRQFAGDLCAACLSRLGNDLRIFNGSQLSAR